MTGAQFLIAMLASWQMVEIWHHGRIFAGWRSDIEARAGLLSALVSCPFCLSVWVGWFVVWDLLAAEHLLVVADQTGSAMDWWLGWTMKLVPTGLAVSRAANLCNDVFYDFTRIHNDRDEDHAQLPEYEP